MIDVEGVRRLIESQFPQLAHLEVKPVAKGGHDNLTFHLGDEMLVRLPSGLAYAPQIEKEITWLPVLKPHLNVEIPSLVAKGLPSAEYDFGWCINTYLEGETVTNENIIDLQTFAVDLATFLSELQAIDASKGPEAGAHNFYRGGDLNVYDEQTQAALISLKDIFDCKTLRNMWNQALASSYQAQPVWVHGDVAVGNLLVREGKLSAVIDFGILGTGDPACDYVMAWTFFDAKSRAIFKQTLNCDEDTWLRAKGWALWKALITYDVKHPNSESSRFATRVIEALLGV